MIQQEKKQHWTGLFCTHLVHASESIHSNRPSKNTFSNIYQKSTCTNRVYQAIDRHGTLKFILQRIFNKFQDRTKLEHKYQEQMKGAIFKYIKINPKDERCNLFIMPLIQETMNKFCYAISVLAFNQIKNYIRLH